MANFTALKTAINNAIKTNGNEEITGAVLQVILDAMVETLGESAITNLEDALSDEITNRQNAVSGVADDLAAEALARAAKDNQLDGRINQEEYNRANTDAALSQTMSQGFQTLGSQMTALNAAISALNAAYQNGYLYGGIATPSSSPSNNKCFYIALQGGTYTNFGGVGVVEGINIIKNDSGWKVEHIYDQTTLLNEFYLLRQQVIQAITSFAPIVIEGDVTNAPDEEDLTSNANHLLQFKNNAYSPLEFSGLGRKYLRKNIAPLSESAPFNGFVEGVTAEETLSGTPTHIFWDRMNTRFVGIKDGVYYLDWTDSDNYVPVSTSLVYMYNGTPYQWTGSDFIVDETEVPNLVNCLTQDMINEANTIYIIRYDYTLKEDIIIPANCVIEFDGGSISGEHTITGTNTGIQAGLVKIFNTDVTLGGSWNIKEVYPQWFGAKINDTSFDNSLYIQKAVYIGKKLDKLVLLPAGDYYVKSPIEVYGFMEIAGCGYKNTAIRTMSATDNAIFIGLETSDVQDSVRYNCTESVIRDLSIVGKGTEKAFDGNCTYCIFQNIQITDVEIAFNLDKSWGLRVNCVKCLSCNYIQKSKYNHGGYENAIYYAECEFYDCTNGIDIYSGKNFVIDKCLFERTYNCFRFVNRVFSVTIINSYFEHCYNIIKLEQRACGRGVITVSNNMFIFNVDDNTLPVGFFVKAESTDENEIIRTHFVIDGNTFDDIETDVRRKRMFYVEIIADKNYFPFHLTFLRNRWDTSVDSITIKEMFDDSGMFILQQSTGCMINSDIPVHAYRAGDSMVGDNALLVFGTGKRITANRQLLKLVFTLKDTDVIDEHYEIKDNVFPTYVSPYGEEYYGVYSAKLQDDSYITGPLRVVTNSIRLHNLSEQSPKYISATVYYGVPAYELQ